ncbi:hypothetical protein NPIL_491011 [Nephila pilipes]|uniref:Uncharacterized protein n=1 Tax=Nephila pilipes TaxID=299642 RepID=A0A8X6NFM3_NEPPI|nr:hypothetical protein NPIL_491011 [Nephila pilipes]
MQLVFLRIWEFRHPYFRAEREDLLFFVKRQTFGKKKYLCNSKVADLSRKRFAIVGKGPAETPSPPFKIGSTSVPTEGKKQNCTFLENSDGSIQSVTNAVSNNDNLQSSEESNISPNSSLHPLVIDLDYDSTEEITKNSDAEPSKKLVTHNDSKQTPFKLVSEVSGEKVDKSDFPSAEHSHDNSSKSYTYDISDFRAPHYKELKDMKNNGQDFIIENCTGQILKPTSSNKIYIKPNDKNVFLELRVKDALIYHNSGRKRLRGEAPVIKTTKEILLDLGPPCETLKVNKIEHSNESSDSNQSTRFPPTLPASDDKLPNRLKRDRSFPLRLRKTPQDSSLINEPPQQFSWNVCNCAGENDRNKGPAFSKREMPKFHESTRGKYVFKNSFYNTCEDSLPCPGDSANSKATFEPAKNNERNTNSDSQSREFSPPFGGLFSGNSTLKSAKKNEANCFETGKNILKKYPGLVPFTALQESSMPFESSSENPNLEAFYSQTIKQKFNSSHWKPNSDGIFLDSVLQSSNNFKSQQPSFETSDSDESFDTLSPMLKNKSVGNYSTSKSSEEYGNFDNVCTELLEQPLNKSYLTPGIEYKNRQSSRLSFATENDGFNSIIENQLDLNENLKYEYQQRAPLPKYQNER